MYAFIINAINYTPDALEPSYQSKAMMALGLIVIVVLTVTIGWLFFTGSFAEAGQLLAGLLTVIALVFFKLIKEKEEIKKREETERKEEAKKHHQMKKESEE